MKEVENKKQLSTAELVKKLEGQIPVGAPQQTKVLNLLGSNLDAGQLEQKFKPPKNSNKNAKIIELEKILISELKQKLGILNKGNSKQVLKVPILDLKNFSNLIINDFIGTKNELNPGVEILSTPKPLPNTQFGEKQSESFITYKAEGTGLVKDDSKRINKLAEKLGILVNDYAIRFEDILVTIDKLRQKLLNYLKDFANLGTAKIRNNTLTNKNILNSLNYPKYYAGPDANKILKNLLGSDFYKLSEEGTKKKILAPVLQNFSSYTPDQTAAAENLQKYYKKYNKEKYLQSLQSGGKPMGLDNDENLKLFYYAKENQLGSNEGKKENDRFYILKVNPLTQFVIAGLQSLDRIKERALKYKDFFDFDRTKLGNLMKADEFDRRNLFAGCFRTFNKFEDASVFMIIFLRAFLKQTSKTLKEIEILIEQQPEDERIAYKAMISATFPFYNSSLASKK